MEVWPWDTFPIPAMTNSTRPCEGLKPSEALSHPPQGQHCDPIHNRVTLFPTYLVRDSQTASQPHRTVRNPASTPAATSLQPAHLLPPAQSTSSPSPLLPPIHLCTFFIFQPLCSNPGHSPSQPILMIWGLPQNSPFLLPLLCFQGTANNFTPTSPTSHT